MPTTRHLRTAMAAVALAGGALAGTAGASAPPVGALPHGPTVTVAVPHGSLFAVALPRAAASTGLVWRQARSYDPRVVREVSEADVGPSVVIVFRALQPGRATIVFALTRGETPTARQAVTYAVRVG